MSDGDYKWTTKTTKRYLTLTDVDRDVGHMEFCVDSENIEYICGDVNGSMVFFKSGASRTCSLPFDELRKLWLGKAEDNE